MKIIAIIADELQPEGWPETFPRPEITDQLAASQHLEQLVTRFNASLRPGERPRNLISFELVPFTEEECYRMGFGDYLGGKENPFTEGSAESDAWLAGWDKAANEDEARD